MPPFNSDGTLGLDAARQRLDAGLIDADDFDEERQGWSAQQLWETLLRSVPDAQALVLTHGDYSLDNIVLDTPDHVSGCLDLGRAGRADRYQDLAILWNCLREFGDTLALQCLHDYGEPSPDWDRLFLAAPRRLDGLAS